MKVIWKRCRYLRVAGTERLSKQDAEEFRNRLFDCKLSRSTINQYSYAIKAYHGMIGDGKIQRLNPNNRPIILLLKKSKEYSNPAIFETLSHANVFILLLFEASDLIDLDKDDVDLKKSYRKNS